MKHLYLGAAILVVLLAVCLLAGCWLGRCSAETSALLRQAEAACISGDGAQAQQLSQQAQNVWNSHRTFLGAVLCHDETDAIRQSFAALLSYAQTRSEEDFLCTCSQLIDLVDHLPESEKPHLHNLL